MKKFWIVGQFDAGVGAMAVNPHKHDTAEKANREASRLSHLNPGSHYVVFEAQTASYTQPNATTVWALGSLDAEPRKRFSAPRNYDYSPSDY